MSTLIKSMVAAAALIGATGAAVGASAQIVCNSDNVCWHVHHHYNYDPGFGVVVHPDNWNWGPNDHYAWKEHHGRGYWRQGAWVSF